MIPDWREKLERREKERELARRMNRAYGEYMAARAETHRLMAETQGARGSDSISASEKLSYLSRRQTEALAEYAQALAEFTDFVIHGIEPERTES